MKKKLSVITLGFILLLMTSTANAATQTFDTWATTDNSPHTITNAGWILANSIVKNSDFDTPSSMPNAAFFHLASGAYLQAPALTYGIGSIIFSCKNFKSASMSSIPLQVQTSQDGTNWTVVATVDSDSKTTWQQKTVIINDNDAKYVRIYKDIATSGANLVGIDDITPTDPPATVAITDVTTIPDSPEANETVNISCTITPSILVESTPAAILSYAIGTGPYTTINMVTNGQQYGYITASPILGQEAGIRVNYYITATFTGNDAMSPTNYPAAGANAPAFYRVKARDYLSSYEQMDVVDSVSSSMILINDYQWQTVIDNSSAIPNANLHFRGTTATPTTNFWGDSSQSSASLPISSTAVLNDSAINLATLPSDQTMLRFNEITQKYLIRQATFQDFDSWPDAPTYSTTYYDNWLAVNAKIETPADADRKLRGKTCILNSNNAAWVQSPYLTDGVGEVSFWYRNWDTNGTPETECYIQLSITGDPEDSEWVTADIISDISVTAYKKYSLPLNDYNYHYVRILANTNNGANAALCIDEFMILYGGSAVSMSNLVASPVAPTASDPIDIFVDITTIVGATNIVATTYYRSGTFGNYTPLLMTKITGNTYKTITPIPPGRGDNNGAGTVQYYVECAFDGLESNLSSPMLHPSEAPDNPASITITPATIFITNVQNAPDPVHINTPISITADIFPIDGTVDISPSLWYRTGNSGAFTEIMMDNSGSATNFITKNNIPGQSIAGEYIQYYLEVNFIGPGADSPTNYPATGYITIPIHAADLTSSFSGMEVAGAINTNLHLIENHTWYGVGSESSAITNGALRFIGQSSSSITYGDASQPFTDMPIFGDAEINQTDIIMGGTNSGTYVFRFTETNSHYNAQLCDYVDFEDFSNADSVFATYTNSDNWIISNARLTAPAETDRTFRGNSCILNSNNAIAYVKSPDLINGIGEVSFWYRNWWESSDTEPITIFVQKSIDGETGWETIATIDSVVNFNYLHFSGFFYEPGYHYVRIVTDTDNPHALLLLDEIVISEAGPGAAFSNLQHTPESPEVPETVDVSVDIIPVHHATDMSVNLWYRFGTNGIFDSIVMNNFVSNTYTTATSIPRGYDGTVEYYVEAGFRGIVESPYTFTTTPASGQHGATNYISSGNSAFFVDFEDWATTDNSPHTITNNNWILHDSIVKDSYTSVSVPNAAWLLANAPGLESYLQSPESSYGVGTISFNYRLFNSAQLPSIPIEILSSLDGVNWTIIDTIDCNAKEWEYAAITLDNPDIRYIRIHKSLITTGPNFIGLDDILITYPASRVSISDVEITPDYPSDNSVTKVSCKIESNNDAFPSANITAQLHYKASSDSAYSVISMAKNGNIFTSEDIPPIAAGELVDYYIAASFAGYHGAQLDNRSPSYFPTGEANLTTNQFYTAPTNTPAAYYVKQEYLSTQHNFDAWTNSTLPGSFTDGGWEFNQIQVSDLDPSIWFSSPFAVELLNDSDWFDSYIQSPIMSNGVGIISFFTQNREEGAINLEVLISTNGINGPFEFLQTVTTTNDSAWTKHSIEINENNPTTIRIRKGDTTGPGYTILLDNIEISYIPSEIEFSSIIFDPGYPTVGQDVYPSCTIVPLTNLFEVANNISARLYYRNKSNGETSYTGPLSMLQQGDKFRTVLPIPGTVNGSRDIIEFYIEAGFNGYHYKAAKNSRSPSFYPTGDTGVSSLYYYAPPLDTPDNYQVRPYLSDYSDITIAISNITVTMTQGADHEWNGFLFIDTDMPDTHLWLNGHGFYDGSDYSSDTDIWSDTNQWKTTLPFAGTMQDDMTGTLLFAPERGAYLIRFNEDNLGYLIERAAFQDFNIWPANPDFFEASFSQAQVTAYPEDFANWPTSIENLFTEDFNTWDTTDIYENENVANGQVGWIIGQAKIVPQLLITNATTFKAHACQLYPDQNFGNIKTVENGINGAGVMTIEYRCVDDTFAPTLYTDAILWEDSMLKGTFKATTLPKNQNNTVMGSNIWVSLIGRYVDDRNYYEMRREQVEMLKYRYSLYKMKNGTLTELETGNPLAGILTANKEMSIFVSTYNSDQVLIEAYEGTTLRLQVFDENDPITMQGQVGIRASGIDVEANNVYSGVARQQTFRGWPTQQGVTTLTKDAWTITYANTINANEVQLMRKSQNPAGQPSVVSPLLTHGAGTISFKNKRGTATSASCNLLIEYSTNKIDWELKRTISLGNTSYQTHREVLDIPVANIYVRLVNDKNVDNNTLYLDNITIEPSPTLGPNWTFDNDDADGWFATHGNWAANNNVYKGDGIVTPVSFALEVAPAYAPNNWELITNINSQLNLEYDTIDIPFHVANPCIPRFAHTYGKASLVVNDIKITSWHGKKNTGTNGWKTQAGWITNHRMADSDNGLEMRSSRALTDEDQFLLSRRMTNGVGTISFNCIKSGSAPVVFAVQRAAETNDLWQTLITVTNNITDWNAPESLFTHNVRTNDSMFIRILHIPQTSDSIMLVDNVDISDFSAKDQFTWTAYNSLITASVPDKLRNSEGNIKGGFLNSNSVDDVDHIQSPLTNDMPYIQSSFLQDGIGEISFWYRTWDTQHIPTLRIKYAPTANTPADNWTELAAIHDITNMEYEHYKILIYNSSNHYVRFYADTDASSAGRICMDDIIITAPFGSDVTSQNITVTPEIPTQNDPVYISAMVTRTFLNPSNVTLTAYWRSDSTANWGTWKHDNPLPMQHISGDYPIGTWRTINPVPSLNIDTLVQYYVETAFDGVFSDRSSPKEDRTFTNPEWYFPVDLNNNVVNTNPYYYVFSSLPGEVWLNEINLVDGWWSGSVLTQYVEVAGHAGIDISKWDLEIMTDLFVTQGMYSVTDSTILPNTQDGYGFWILGENSLTDRADMFLTNTIPQNGAVRLYRSMGAIEDGICFGGLASAKNMTNDPNNRLIYIGVDDDFFNANPLSLIGEGSNRTDFTEDNWVNSQEYTVGAMNDGQTLINGGDMPLIQIMITDASLNGNQVWLVFTTDAGYDIQPQPWYSTNLLNETGWNPVSGFIDTSYNNGIYTQKFDAVDSPIHNYKVIGINQ